MKIENAEGQVSLFDQDSCCGRTSPARSPATADGTSSASCQNASESRSRTPLTCLTLKRENGQKLGFSWETDGALLGAYSTRNIGEYPSDAVESRLSAISEDNPPEKYFLTDRAAIGILRRAERRGKKIPETLRFALERQSGLRRDTFGQAQIADAGEILRALRREIGAASFVEWVRRAAVLFQQKKILLCGVRGSGKQRSETETACQFRGSEPSKSETCNSLCPVRYLRENGLYGSSSYRQEPDEQLTRKLSALVQELSRQTTPYKAFLRCLRSAYEGTLPVYEVLASVAEKQSARLGYGLYEINQSRNAESGSNAVVCAYPAIARSLTARGDRPGIETGSNIVAQSGVKCLNPWDSQSGRVYDESGAFHSLNANENGGMSRDAVLAAGFSYGQGGKARSIGWQDETSPTLRGGSGGDERPCVFDARGDAVLAVHQNQFGEVRVGAVANTLSTNSNASGRNAPLCYDARGNGDGKTCNTMTSSNVGHLGDYTPIVVQCLTANQYKQKNREGAETYLSKGGIVRRLTPLECERLQGFPSEKKVDLSAMTKDEYIAWNISVGNIVVDAESGKVFATRGPGGIALKEPKELKGSVVNGYRTVSIRNGTTKLQCRVHRIVWVSRNGVIPDGYCIDHINNDKQDNRIANLQLLTPAENSTKAAKDGLYKTGEDNAATKLSPDLHDEIAFLYHCSDVTLKDLAEIYGVSKSRIHQIVKEIGYTDIGDWTDDNGKTHKTSDSARYRALGNSIALPPWKWVLKRIAAQYERDATLGSLFDGIGGFPLLWEQINGRGSALWASEIDSFCIAVTKLRIAGSKR